MIQQLHFWVYSKELKAGSQTGVCIPIFNTALFTAAKRGKQLTYLHTGEWIRKIQYTQTMKYYSAFKKKENSDTCYSMDEPSEYLAK